jgi:thiamine pyrophosphokinase
MKTVVVFAGGEPPSHEVVSRLPEGAFVIAADSGIDHASRLGIKVDLLVGDLDSVSSQGLETAGEKVELHPADKDDSDLTLALRAATRRGARRVVVVGGSGGRIDHLLTNSAVLTSEEFASQQIEWFVGPATALVVRSEVEIQGQPGDLVTLLPQGGDAVGVTTEGLRWPLVDETIKHGSSRGLSNLLTSDVARVTVATGVLLAIHSPAGVD